jgi:hypothetical protein
MLDRRRWRLPDFGLATVFCQFDQSQESGVAYPRFEPFRSIEPNVLRPWSSQPPF